MLQHKNRHLVRFFDVHICISAYRSIIRSISLTIPAGLSDRGNVYKYNVSFTIWDGVANSTVAYSPYWDLDNFPPPNASPQVLAVTSSNTTGDYVTVTGTWFGPVDQNLVNYVQLGSGFCTDYSVIQENTKLRCEAPEGAGALLSARTSVNGRIGLLNGTGLFSYNRPSITGITPPDTATGFTLIQGYNFVSSRETRTARRFFFWAPCPELIDTFCA